MTVFKWQGNPGYTQSDCFRLSKCPIMMTEQELIAASYIQLLLYFNPPQVEDRECFHLKTNNQSYKFWMKDEGLESGGMNVYMLFVHW